MEKVGRDTVVHAPYVHDSAPLTVSYYTVQDIPVKKNIKIGGVERVVSELFNSQSPLFWERRIAELPNRWNIGVATDGDYLLILLSEFYCIK